MQEAYYTIPPAFPSTGTYAQTQSLCGQEYVSPSSTVFVYKRYFKQGSFIFGLFLVIQNSHKPSRHSFNLINSDILVSSNYHQGLASLGSVIGYELMGYFVRIKGRCSKYLSTHCQFYCAQTSVAIVAKGFYNQFFPVNFFTSICFSMIL